MNQVFVTPVRKRATARAYTENRAAPGVSPVANKGNNNGQPPERSRVRVIIAEAEGTPAEIQQLIVSVATALRPQQVVVYPQQLPPASHQQALNGAAKPAERAGLFDDVQDAEPVEAAAEVVQPTVVTPAPKPQNGAAKRKLRTPQLVSNLEFVSGEKPLTDYIKEVDPKEHSKRYLAIVYWLKKYRNLDEVGADHVYTCYRSLGMHVPDDVGSILRALKGQTWLEKGSKAGFYKITHIGENQLTKGKE